MLYRLASAFPDTPLRLFDYVTFRTGGAMVTALLVSLIFGPGVIEWLRGLFREDYSDTRLSGGAAPDAAIAAKKGTPTMGGILIVLAIDLAVLLWAKWNPQVLLVVMTLLVLAGLGFYDDYLKVTRRNSEGAKSRVKLIVQALLAGGIALYLWMLPSTRNLVAEIQVPFLKSPLVWGTPLAGGLLVALTLIGSSNACNLTDGMDGLAISCTLVVALVLLFMSYIADNVRFATYLQVPHVRGASELCVVCGALVGASLGFLWFNCFPAQVFMGDIGSLSLGGTLGLISVLIHQPLVLVIAGGVFVAEALSVMLQVGWFKYTRRRYGEGRRLLLISPLHNHFRRKGWPETRIVTRFVIVSILCGVAALATLKIR